MKIILLKLYKYYKTYLSSMIERRLKHKEFSNKILIFRHDGLGDFFLMIPILQSLIEQGFELCIIAQDLQLSILDSFEIPCHKIPFRNRSHNDIRKIIKEVQVLKVSHAFNLSMNIWGGIIVNSSRADVKAGLLQENEYYIYKGHSLFYDTCFSYDKLTHQFYCIQGMISAYFNLKVLPTLNRDLNASKHVVIHPFAQWNPRIWPYFDELIQRLLSHYPDYKITIIGTEKEFNNHILKKNYKNHCMILESIHDLINVIKSAELYIGNDSGPAHLASILNIKGIILWGPGFFERIRPLSPHLKIVMKEISCRPCRQIGPVCQRGDNFCLKQISVDEVMVIFNEISKM